MSPPSPANPTESKAATPASDSTPYQFNILTKEQRDTWEKDGILVIKAAQYWKGDELARLLKTCEEVGTWPDAPGKWMKYYEKNLHKEKLVADGKTEEAEKLDEKILCRVENFIDYEPTLAELLNGKRTLDVVSDLFGEDAILYKEKINYKLPGGAGFNPHQDVLAGWTMYGQTLHISQLISIDPANETNGGLELVYGKHKDGLMAPMWKELSEETCAKLKWEMARTEPGDVVFFDSYVPHRSGPNNTDKARRVLYTTFAKASEGDWRKTYYADKRKSFPPDCERDPNKTYEYKI